MDLADDASDDDDDDDAGVKPGDVRAYALAFSSVVYFPFSAPFYVCGVMSHLLPAFIGGEKFRCIHHLSLINHAGSPFQPGRGRLNGGRILPSLCELGKGTILS